MEDELLAEELQAQVAAAKQVVVQVRVCGGCAGACWGRRGVDWLGGRGLWLCVGGALRCTMSLHPFPLDLPPPPFPHLSQTTAGDRDP